MEKEQFYNLIEQYLDGSLTGEALDAFEKRLRAEPDLASEVELHRKLQKELGNAQKRELRSKLAVLKEEFTEEKEESKIVPINRNRSFRILVSVAACFLIFSLAFWYFFLNPSEKNEIVNENPSIEKDEITLPNETPIKEIDDPSNLVEDNSKIEKDQNEPNPVDAPNQPSQMAKFAPNPELEQLIAQNESQRGFEFDVEKPSQNESFLLKNNKIKFQINGILFASELENENNFEVVVYDNDPQNFKSKNNIATFNLPLEKDTSQEDEGLAFATKEAYFFGLQKTLDFKAGLYYYVILQKGQAEPLFTGKFQILEGK